MRSSRRVKRNRRKMTRRRKQRGGVARHLILQMPIHEGLGNQLFLFAIGIRAQKYTKLPLYIILNKSKYHTTNSYKSLYERHDKNIFILDTDNPKDVMSQAKDVMHRIPTQTSMVKNSDFNYNSSNSGNVKVPESLYQNYAGVQNEIADVKSLLLQNEFENEKNKNIYDPIRSETDSVHSAYLHIRLGDYIKFGAAQKVEFYTNALKELNKNELIKVIYVICSDEKYYRENESKLKEATTKELRFYHNANELIVFYKMMLCTAGAIISASTFGAWGAMLGADTNPKSTIVYPKQWIKFKDWGDNPLMFPPRWIPIESTGVEGEHGFDWKKEAEKSNR